jgi:3-hydroxyacyl-[acyl-carrier-protein] dehydratase
MRDHSRIRALLPQRHPMLLVDRVIRLEPGVSICATKAITGSEPCYQGLAEGLAPQRYAYPTSLLIESFGQAAALLWLASDQPGAVHSDEVLLFAAARDCHVHGHAFPGDVLRHMVRLDAVAGGAAFAEGETWVDERRIASFGSLIATVRPISTLLPLRVGS